MATDRDLVLALRAVAEKLLGRALTPNEEVRLIEYFNQSQAPNNLGKAYDSLDKIASINTRELAKTASDNTDRVFQDLNNVITNWKPGSK